MPRKKPGINKSDADVLRPRKAKGIGTSPSYYPGDGPPTDVPVLGADEPSIIAAMNWVFANAQRLEKKEIDGMTTAARICLSAVKSHDDKSEIDRLQRMVADATSAANQGLRHEAADRHHTNRDTESASDETDE